MLGKWLKPKQNNQGKKFFRLDTLTNMFTKMGTIKDKRSGSVIQFSIFTSRALENLYDDNAMAKKIVDIYPKNATREWIELENIESEEKQLVEKELKRLKVKEKFFIAGRYSRLYGGGALFISDGTPMEQLIEPLKITNKTQIQALVPFNKYELQASSEKVDDVNEENFGMPEFYSLNTTTESESSLNAVKIHHSRFIIIQGESSSKTTFESNDYFGLSVLQRIQSLILDYTTSYDLLPNLISDFRVFVFKMKGLIESMTECQEINGTGKTKDAEDEIKDRMEALRMSRSILSQLAIDSEDDIEQITPNVSGLQELYQKINERLIAESDIPHTILMGESPKGSNATGNSTTIDWYSKVKDWQERNFKDGLERIFKILSNSLKIKDIGFSFKPLFKPTQKEIVETRKIQAEQDNINILNGVLSAEEVRESRFGGDKYSFETKVEGDIENEFEEEEEDKNSKD